MNAVFNFPKKLQIALPLCLLPLAPVLGQSIVVPPPAPPPAAESSPIGGPKSLALVSSALSSGLPLIRRGPVSVRPHFFYRFIVGEDIQAGPGIPRDTSIHSIAPGVLFEIGNHWQLDYTPTWVWYSSEAFRDSFDQSGTLNGSISRGKWAASITQNSSVRHSMLVETGRQTRVASYLSGLKGSYQAGQYTTFETSATRNARYANPVTEAPEWTTSDWVQWTSTNWINYNRWSRLQTAAGVSFGYDEVKPGPDMTFVVPQGRITWRPVNKISLSGQVGVESRRFRAGSRRTLSNPVYNASFSYEPFAATKLTLEGSGELSASYYANEITKTTAWSARLDQRLLGKFYFSGIYSEADTGYSASRIEQPVRREDHYRAFTTRLSTSILQRVSITLLYQTGQNSSDHYDYRFKTSQYGVEISHRF